jgi:hypothetical protein
MAKRKAARATGTRTSAKRSRAATKPSKSTRRARGAAKVARKAAGAGRKKSAKPAARRPQGRKKVVASVARKTKAPAPKVRSGARRLGAGQTRTAKPRPAARKAARPAVRPAATPAPAAGRTKAARFKPPHKAPALDRQRRTIVDDDLLPTPPSTLDLDRSASSVRSGRKELRERYDVHTETGPAITAGDIDADWESAYSVGDEAPGGDNPTPDQDIVDEIGRAVGINYDDNEELKGANKITERDRHRWELDPASSDDYEDR